MSAPPLPPSVTQNYFIQDAVTYIQLPPPSTITQLYDASRVTSDLQSRSLYLSISTLTNNNIPRYPGPKFSSDQDRIKYKVGQFSYLSPR